MTNPRQLTEVEIQQALRTLPGWEVREGKLHRAMAFRDFVDAWGWMSAAALRIQAMDHHPEWFNVYGVVRIDLVTHDVGGISARDVELAHQLEDLHRRWPHA